jgi:ribulose-phosphate 3-epimerase
MGEDREVLIAPSLMCADQLRLGEETRELVSLGADWLHLDIMDGHYVPNYTFGTDQCRALADAFDLPLDMHLMVDEPDTWAPVFAGIGTGSIVTIHPETTWHPARTLQAIRDAGARPGLAVDPGARPGQFRNLLELVDLVLIMCVNPGYSGQKLLPWTLDSIREARALRDERGLSFRIEVDGNVSWENIPGMLEAGADVLVAGSSSLFDSSMDRGDAAVRLKGLVGRG